MTVDLSSLEAFVVFAEKMNFTRAAEELGISQPALHVKVRKLGESLGVSLYRREGRERNSATLARVSRPNDATRFPAAVSRSSRPSRR
jgi:DNA-binding transcriptional LysR family regulator